MSHTIKRTKNINKDRFRKVQKYGQYTIIAAALSSVFILSGCDDSTQVSVFKSIQDCERSAQDEAHKNQCTLDYQNALANASKSAPKYNSPQDCEEEFGKDKCVIQQSTSNNVSTSNGTHSSFVWIPMMQGYSSSSANYPSQALYSSSKPGTATYNKFVDAKGNSFGSFVNSGRTTVSSSAVAPKAATTTTTTRSGFGSTVHAQSAHSSSSHSMGG